MWFSYIRKSSFKPGPAPITTQQKKIDEPISLDEFVVISRSEIPLPLIIQNEIKKVPINMENQIVKNRFIQTYDYNVSEYILGKTLGWFIDKEVIHEIIQSHYKG